MFPGSGGMDDRKMQQMMKQMGIEMDELEAEEVIIRMADEELVFTEPDVQRMDAQGQQTYTIIGDAETRERGASESSDADADAAADDPGAADSADDGTAIDEDDVEIVAMRADVSQADAREALEATDGDLAAAVKRLE